MTERVGTAFAIIILMKHLLPLILSFACTCGAPSLDLQKNDNENFETSTSSNNSTDARSLKIIIFDVGQGSSALIVAPNGDAALIDTGPPLAWNAKIKPYLTANSNINLKYLFISHDDSDHSGGVKDSGMMPEEMIAGDFFTLGDNVNIEVIAKDCTFSDGEKISCDAKDDNTHSAVILLTYGAFKYLNTGDLPGGGGNPPYDTIDLESKTAGLVGDIDILSAGHHGSNTATNQNLLNVTKPEVAIISVGDNNFYWHPHQTVTTRLINSGIKVYQTERGWLKDEFLNKIIIKNGDVTIESDGNTYSVF